MLSSSLPSPTWYERLPKVELHLHLEGALPIQALWELVQKYDGNRSIGSLDELRSRFVYRDFPHFLDLWIWKNQYLREYEDFTFLAETTARDLVRQNVQYAEVFFSPTDFANHGLEVQPLARAIRSGLERVPQVEIALIADLVRSEAQRAERTLSQVYEVRNAGIIGVGIGGNELGYPPEAFAAVYRRARALGFHTTAHAGEGAGPNSIWGALNSLEVERIGHGTRAGEDPALLDFLRERRIPLEMCPQSNVCTGVVPSIEAHPIRRFFNLGLLVTVNTDDPTMFNNRLAQEYQQLVKKLGFSPEDVHMLLRNAIEASWLPAERKESLAAQLSDSIQNLAFQ